MSRPRPDIDSAIQRLQVAATGMILAALFMALPRILLWLVSIRF